MSIDRTLAGHRVLRLLARGDRSMVWLGAGNLALKHLNRVSADGASRELQALHRAHGAHVVELQDVSMGEESVVMVFRRLPSGSLAELLRRRTHLDAGEAVTLLAPLGSAVARMHDAGVAHLAISPSTVLFSSDGAPVLTGFGRSELFSPGMTAAALETVGGVEADRAALLAIADGVLSRVAGSRSAVAIRLRDELRSAPLELVTPTLTRELFELAAARPVRFDADDQDRSRGPSRVVPALEGGATVVSEPTSPSTGRVAALANRFLETGPAATVRDVVAEHWGRWTVRRRRVAIAAAAGGLALMTAISVIPTSEPEQTFLATPPPSSPPPQVLTDDESAVLDDDPLAALSELVDRRDRCFRELSVLCLDGVDAPESPALEVDRAALSALLHEGVSPDRLPLDSMVLVERLGASALVDLGPESDPASVLLLKGEAGWRIRDYLAAQVASGERGD